MEGEGDGGKRGGRDVLSRFLSVVTPPRPPRTRGRLTSAPCSESPQVIKIRKERLGLIPTFTHLPSFTTGRTIEIPCLY